jgi:anti-anti-sigma factor
MLTCESPDRLLIRFEGRLDTARCAEIGDELRAAVTAPAGPVVFDLQQVDFISSAFLRLCIFAHQQAGNHGFQVSHACPTIKRVLKIAGLDAMFQCE